MSVQEPTPREIALAWIRLAVQQPMGGGLHLPARGVKIVCEELLRLDDATKALPVIETDAKRGPGRPRKIDGH